MKLAEPTKVRAVAIVAPAELSDQQQKDFVAVISAPSVREAAKLLKCHPSTLYRRLSERVLGDALRDARHQMLGRGIHQLHAAAEEAAICLRSIIRDPGAKTGHRIQAARVALAYGFEGLTVDRLEGQVALLEEQTKVIQEHSWG